MTQHARHGCDLDVRTEQIGSVLQVQSISIELMPEHQEY